MAQKKPRIVVIGDLMLDIYRYGDVDRISPEAPVPVVLLNKTVKNLGGAGNTFANLYHLGANCKLMATVGRDHYGLVEIPNLLHDNYPGAETQLFQNIAASTTVKERVIARGQQICRIDRETVDAPISNFHGERVSLNLRLALSDCDVLLISDYAKGFYNEELRNVIHEEKINKKFIVVLDPHPKNAHLYKDIDYATPNKKEWLEIGGSKFWDMGCSIILRTEGPEGMTLIGKEDADYHIGTVAQEVFDVSGAGDTVCAVFSYMLAHRFGVTTSMEVANRCAGIVVAKQGTVPIERHEFDRMLRGGLKNAEKGASRRN
jgi:D-beta-D-heptose 7-phosphate kinase/D-beta-D-heptose 1-phosphate adenosyltransferase